MNPYLAGRMQNETIQQYHVFAFDGVVVCSTLQPFISQLCLSDNYHWWW